MTAIWGVTFVMVKEAIEKVPPFEFLAIRFIMAAAILAIVFPRRAAAVRRTSLTAGAIAGAALGAGYAFQTVGLQYTGATKAGFITGLAVVFTPPLSARVLKRPPSRAGVIGVAIAAAGLALLTAGPSLNFNAGDGLVLFCAVSFAIHIVVIGRFAPAHDPRTLTIVQLGLSGIAFSAIAIAGEDLKAPDSSVWIALLVTAVGASAVAFLAQTWAQRHLSPTATAVTFTMEPVFAGLAGFALLGERLSVAGWVGATLILGAMLLATTRSGDR
ncbi:MAG: DMT family transporter [Actinobacteria bacterium]|nr:DMT family transporter [Actinomycetota bacterium]